MLEVDKKTFEDEVLKAEGYVFVDFFGDGCVPCQALMPFVHEMADKYGDKIKFTSLNTTKARRLAIGQKILGLPVMAIYKDGEKVEEVVKDDATQESIEAAHSRQRSGCVLTIYNRVKRVKLLSKQNFKRKEGGKDIMAILKDKKVVIIGDRDGVPGPAIAECVKTAGGDVVFSSTECFV